MTSKPTYAKFHYFMSYITLEITYRSNMGNRQQSTSHSLWCVHLTSSINIHTIDMSIIIYIITPLPTLELNIPLSLALLFRMQKYQLYDFNYLMTNI